MPPVEAPAVFVRIISATLLARCAALVLVAFAISGCGAETQRGMEEPILVSDVPTSGAAPVAYVGSASCETCHQAQYARWQQSHHAQAMAIATPDTVLGNFDNTEFDQFGVRTHFRRDEKGFWIDETNAGGAHTYEVTHTFGVSPLQQYLVSFPDGRLQAHGVVTDVRDPAKSKWYSLYPHEPLASGSALHWQGHLQTWNFQCADCHTTHLRKGYDAQTNTYTTRWSELGVGCEACHGPGADHIAWAAAPTALEGRGFAFTANSAGFEDVCARCHSRRSQIAEGFAPGQPWLNYYTPALLRNGLYQADGQVEDEVFVYGSFLQSRMHAAGVTCGDCHESHSGELHGLSTSVKSERVNMSRGALELNVVCTRCHQENPPTRFATLQAKNYDAKSHHFHETTDEGAACVACHMPSKLFMGIDERHDHSFRIPRPDLTVSTGVSNACTACHDDRSATWAALALSRLDLQSSRTSIAPVFAEARRGDWRAQAALLDIVQNEADYSVIVRATALSMLRTYPMLPPKTRDHLAAVMKAALNEPEPLLRLGALVGLANCEFPWRAQVAVQHLQDPLLSLRLQAMVTLAPDIASLGPTHIDALRNSLLEHRQTAGFNADRADVQVNYASLLAVLGMPEQARERYAQALRLDANWPSALLGLAELNRREDQELRSETLFQNALGAQLSAPERAPVHLSYGLWLVRQGRANEALEQLQLAATKEATPEVRYVYAIALNSTGDVSAAVDVLESNLSEFEFHTDSWFALSTVLRDSGDLRGARDAAQRLVAMVPLDDRYRELLASLSERP